jgi:uncharacterized membrane protein
VKTAEAGALAPDQPAPLAARQNRPALVPIAADSRTWWSVAGLTLVVWGFRLFGYVDMYPALGAAVAVLVIWGLGTVAAVWLPRRPVAWVERALAAATVALTAVGFFLWSYLQVVVAPGYGTDELAFDQYAAQLLRRGADPYTHSMAPAFHFFHVSPDGYTFLLNGHPVTALSYPALSFLFYVPLLMLGWSTQLAVVVDVVAWAIAIVAAFLLLPRSVRPVALVVGSLSVYVGYAVGGVTDALFVPLLVGAVYRWDRFGELRGWRAWRGPVLLGLAMAVKQTPWLVLPFVAAGVALEPGAVARGKLAEGLRAGGRYLAIALGAFAVPNLPFIVLSPHAWLTDVLTPVASHTVPAGQGLVELSLFLGIGGGSLDAYRDALVVVFVVLWLIFVATYPRCKAWAVLLPSIVLFFSARSLGSYLVTLLLPAIVAAFSVDPSLGGSPTSATIAAHRVRRARRRLRPWWVVAGGAAVSGAVVGLALASRPPLSVRIVSVRTTGQLATVVQVGVSVTNTSGRTAAPAFSVESGGQLTAFWLERGGPARLAPGASARYTLLAPNFFAQPPITGGFQVVISHSAAYVPTTWHVTLSPDSVSRLVPLGDPVTVHAAILDRLDSPVRVAGEPVYLGQVIYSQQGLVYGQAIINQGQVGQTPVVAYTNREGVATFTIRGTRSSSDPVYFEANLVDDRQFYPYGYSEIVPIRFGGRR